MRAVERIAMPIQVRLFETPANSLLRLYAGGSAGIAQQDGGGLIDDFMAQGPRPPAEIHIAEARSELLIKSAELLKYRLTQCHESTGNRRDVARQIVPGPERRTECTPEKIAATIHHSGDNPGMLDGPGGER